jgi:hypothetical protein
MRCAPSWSHRFNQPGQPHARLDRGGLFEHVQADVIDRFCVLADSISLRGADPA